MFARTQIPTILTLSSLVAGCHPAERPAKFDASGCYKSRQGDMIYIDEKRISFSSTGNIIESKLEYTEDKIGNTLITNPSASFDIDVDGRVNVSLDQSLSTVIRVYGDPALILQITDVYNGRKLKFIRYQC